MTKRMIADVVSRYEAYRRNERQFSSATWRGERSTLFALAATLDNIGRRYLSDVKPEDMELWLGLQEHLADSTLVTRGTQVRRFFQWCRDRGWIDTDPMVTVSVRRPMLVPRERLTAAELLALIETAEYPQHRIVLALAANLALRASEIRELRVSDVALGASRVRVTVGKTREVDDMPITAELDVELRRWLSHYAPIDRSRAVYLVPSQRSVFGDIRNVPDQPCVTAHRIVQAGLTRLGWETTKQEGVHTVRRSVARIFYDTLATANEADALLGTMRLLHHARPETTLRYIGVDKQAQIVEDTLAGKPFLTTAAGNVTHMEVAR